MFWYVTIAAVPGTTTAPPVPPTAPGNQFCGLFLVFRIGRLVEWLFGWLLLDFLVVELVGWIIGWPIGWLTHTCTSNSTNSTHSCTASTPSWSSRSDNSSSRLQYPSSWLWQEMWFEEISNMLTERLSNSQFQAAKRWGANPNPWTQQILNIGIKSMR